MFHYSRFHACSFVQQAGLLCKTLSCVQAQAGQLPLLPAVHRSEVEELPAGPSLALPLRCPQPARRPCCSDA